MAGVRSPEVPRAPRPRPRRRRRSKLGGPLFAYTRARKIASVQYLVEQGEHARREDATGAARVRPDAIPGTSLGWSILDGPVPEPRLVHDTRYDQAQRAHARAHGARRRGNAGPLGLHLQVNVSPEWIEEGGGLHDPANPRIKAHFRAAIDWARETFGPALFALRVDLDETGGGVLDAFLSPLRQLKQKGKAYSSDGGGPLWISVNRAMEELTTRFGHRRSENWGAINSSWAAYARAHLDPRLERGVPKRLSRRRHVPIDQVRRAHEALDARDAELEQEAIALKRREAILAHVMAATLAGRIEPDAAGEPAVRPSRALAGCGVLLPLGSDSELADHLRRVEPAYASLLRIAMDFVQRHLRLGRATVDLADAAGTGVAPISSPAAETGADLGSAPTSDGRGHRRQYPAPEGTPDFPSESDLAEASEWDDPSAISDLASMTPKPW